MDKKNISDYLKAGKHVHLVGIGGVSMAPLGEILAKRGLILSGSDVRESDTVKHLRNLGIKISIGHNAENLGNAEFVIRTAAAHDDNPEIAGAYARGIPVFERAEAWGALMKKYENAVCIAGTHGKTTTTGMCTHITIHAAMDPSVMIGGTLPLLDACHRVGHGDTIILESCEYRNSFLSFFPTVAAVVNIDADHLDFFHDIEDIKNSFRKFAELVPKETGSVVINRDDENSIRAMRGIDRRTVTFGLKEGDIHTENLVYNQGVASYDLIVHGQNTVRIELNVPGQHNVYNSLCAAAVSTVLGIAPEHIRGGLREFNGAHRRFERKGIYNGAAVYDDYAHHPGELAALFNMTEKLGYNRVICAFQPHTYSRTKALFPEFIKELSRPDIAILAEIYAARETNELGISSKDLAEQIPHAEYYPTLREVAERLSALSSPGDLIITVGAGDIYTVGETLIHRNSLGGTLL